MTQTITETATSKLRSGTIRRLVNERLINAPLMRMSEIISALSVALDLTQGHPQGHCMRSCLIGMRIADTIRLSDADRSSLFYALLLKDLGCSSNAAKIAHLFNGDDHQIKHSTRLIDWTNSRECFSHGWKNFTPGGSTIEKLIRMAAMVRSGTQAGRRLIEIRCERGAEIARMLQLSDTTAQAILDLDEHWNGAGNPKHKKKDEISLLGRICGLAQCVEVFLTTFGLSAAYGMAWKRRGRWFDPELVDVLGTFQNDEEFWARLDQNDLIPQVARLEPRDIILLADDFRLDQVADAFAYVVDAKSPWTFLHSSRVAEIASGIAQQFNCSPGFEQDIRRAGLLHDIGKLGVSNAILDKPGKPTDNEFAQIRRHAEYSYQILNRVPAFTELARVAGAHHERLDGTGYYRGMAGNDISFATRILTVADVCEAMTAKRPYREALEWKQVQSILRKDIGKGVDGDCVDALQCWYEKHELVSRVDLQTASLETVTSGI